VSRSRPNVPGFHAVLLSLLSACLVFCLQLLAVALPADVPAAAFLFVEAAGWMLTCAVVLGFWGATRMRTQIDNLHAQIDDLQQRLAVALTDPVTGLPVRRVAEDAIVAAGPTTLLTVAVADIDGLHDINHGPGGYATGDHYLTEAGHRLQQAATDGDLVARLGGDEFVLITARTPRQLASTLTAAFADPTTVGAGLVPLAVSVGICQLPGGDPHHLVGGADLAMLTAKRRQTRTEIYDPARDGRPLPPGVRPGSRRRSGR
jgi:diguanylate cyclase (GGDEF)-like protein